PTDPPQNVQPDGKYLLVSNKVLTRYNPDGSVDRSFGNNGSVSDFTTGTSASTFDPAKPLVLGYQIFVTGVATYLNDPNGGSYNGNLATEKFTTAGAMDRAF